MGLPCFLTIYDHGDDDVRSGLIIFARRKLLCTNSSGPLTKAQEYAVLSHRLVLDSTRTCHILSPGNPFAEMEKEQEQISSHMHVCVSIGAGMETIRGITPSEPILSEAASLVMRDVSFEFNLADALVNVLKNNNNTGDRAELLVSAFFTWARDRAVSVKPHYAFHGQLSWYFTVLELFDSLFSEAVFTSMSASTPSISPPNAPRHTFAYVFRDAFIHFTHHIRPQEQKLLAKQYLPYFMARGVAVLGANCQPGIDAVYPYLYQSTELDSKNVGFILVQVKTNHVSPRYQDAIFKKMDPFMCDLLQDSDCVDSHFPIPIIRIAFALCCKSSTQFGVTHKTYTSPSQGSLGNVPNFTSYDFWCSGVDPDIIKPVKEAPNRWKGLVNRAEPWEVFYNDTPNGSSDMLRSHFPVCGSNNAHFSAWANVVGTDAGKREHDPGSG